MPEPRKLLILACARSGTKYIHKVFQKIGLDIGHEYTGKDGSATHFWAVDPPKCLEFPWESPKDRKAHIGERRSDFEFEHIWHQIRNPLNCITSNSLVIPRNEWEWLSQYIPIPVAKHDTKYLSMLYWLHWNTLCEHYADTSYRIEDIDHEWPLLTDMLGIPRVPLPPVNKQMNRAKRWSKPFVDRDAIKKAPDLTWADLDAIDPLLADLIRVKADRFGYSTED
jgi:hypothetical protein